MTLADMRVSAGVMVGEVCRFYGWTVDYVLAMQASRFFLMFETAKKLQSAELQRSCYVSRSAQLTNKAFEETVEFFGSLGGTEPKQLPPKPVNAAKPQAPLSGDAAASAVMGAFAKDTRINRMQPAKPKPKHPGGGRG